MGALLALSAGAGGGAVVDEGVLPALVKLLGASGAPGQPAAVQLLRVLASGTDTRKAVSMQPGVVAGCVGTLQRGYSSAAAEHAAGLLHALADAGKRAEIVQAGGVEALTLVLRAGLAPAKRQAVHALSSLAEERPNPNPNPNPSPNRNPDPDPDPN